MRRPTAKSLLADAREHYADARRLASRGDCHAAFASLKLAGLMDGEAHGVALSGRGTLPEYARVASLAFSAEEAFADSCIRRRHA
jgi:hypothetical protein